MDMYTSAVVNLVDIPQPHHTQKKLTYRKHVTEGFDKMFDAFMELFSGANIGKVVVNKA